MSEQENESAAVEHSLTPEQVRALGPTGEAMYAQMHGSLPRPSLEETDKPDLTVQGQEMLALLDRIHRSYADLRNKLTGEQLFDQMVAGLSSHPSFIGLVKQIAQEFFAEFIAEQSREHDHHHDVRELADPPGVTSYKVDLKRDRTEDATMRVALLSSNHPTTPNGLDVYVLREDGADVWDHARVPPLLHNELRKELVAIAAEPYAYYWVELKVFSSTPINESSQKIAEAETIDGPEQVG